MDFEHAQSTLDIVAEVEGFFADEILPRNRDWQAWSRSNLADPAWLGELRTKARARVLWNMALTDLPEGADPDVLVKSLLEAARDFAREPITDDIAILAVRRA